MKALAFAAALLAGCGAMANHPTATVVTAAVGTMGLGVCAIDCGAPADHVADGVLITEAAVVVMASIAIIYVVSSNARPQ